MDAFSNIKTSKSTAPYAISHLFPTGEAVRTNTAADVHAVVIVIVVTILFQIVAHGVISRVDIESAARQSISELACSRGV